MSFVIYQHNKIISLLLIMSASLICKMMRSYNKLICRLIDENSKIKETVREYNHNLKSKLLSLGLVTKENLPLINDVLIIKSFSGANKNLKNVPKCMCALILEKIDDKDITFNFINELNYKKVRKKLDAFKFYEFLKLTSIALDNAVESSLCSENPYIQMRLIDKDGCIFLEISNSFNAVLNIDQLGEKNKSSKGINRGIGLYTIFNSKEVDSFVEIRDNVFKLTLKVKKIK